MNPLVGKLLPYAGWPLALLMFTLWIGLKEDLAEQQATCNSEKLQSVMEAEKIAREALQEAHSRRLSELESLVLAEGRARRVAETARLAAESGAEDAQNTIRRLVAEARGAENATIEQECLSVSVDPAILDSLRTQ